MNQWGFDGRGRELADLEHIFARKRWFFARIGETATELTFTCPAARDQQEPGGSYSTYAGPVLLDDASATITCM